MRECPERIGNARVVCFTRLDERHRRTGRTEHLANGALMGPPAGLAICQYEREPWCYYLFGCDEDWESFSDTWHETIEGAKAQAEHEFEGTLATWTCR